MDQAHDKPTSEQFGQLFLAMAEELKLPLMHMVRTAELDMLTHGAGAAAGKHMQDIRDSADMTLQLLDSYLLSLRLSLEPESRLLLEPVSMSAILHDTAQELERVAKQYGVQLQVHVQGRYEPVLVHRQALQRALVSLGYAVIEALPATGVPRAQLQLATHRTRHGIVAGLYGDFGELTPQALRRATSLHGYARQPLVGTVPGSGAGIFVADAILQAMASRLRVGRYHNMPGFAATLRASEQLQLVTA